jgi:hypothetical protein
MLLVLALVARMALHTFPMLVLVALHTYGMLLLLLMLVLVLVLVVSLPKLTSPML